MNLTELFDDMRQELSEETLSDAYSSFVESVNNQINP